MCNTSQPTPAPASAAAPQTPVASAPERLSELMKRAAEHPEFDFVPLVAVTLHRGPEDWEDFLSDLSGLLGEYAVCAGRSGPDGHELGAVLNTLNQLRTAFRDVRGGEVWDNRRPKW